MNGGFKLIFTEKRKSARGVHSDGILTNERDGGKLWVWILNNNY